MYIDLIGQLVSVSSKLVDFCNELNVLIFILIFCSPACIAVYKSRDPNKMNYIFCLLGLLK